jgi:osmotically-inducible protein OsmY
MGKTQDIRTAVEGELVFDPLVDSTDITVRNLDGAVALNGTVASYPQYLEAEAAARRVAGVTHVQNHLEVLLSSADYRDDPTLATMANNALFNDVTVPVGVEAKARDGNLTLIGTVDYGVERTAAAAAVAGLIGVRNVKNHLRINAVADPVDVVLAVQDALDRYSLVLDDSDVLVDTEENNVTLTGHVRTWAEHDAVVNAAWMAGGVYDVDDDLVITG